MSHHKVKDVSDAIVWIELLGECLVFDYSITLQENLNNREIMNPAGHLLSGSSDVNVGNWMRASTADHDVIGKRVGHGMLSFKNIVRYFKRLEIYFVSSVDKEGHGLDGPIHTIGGRR